MRICDAIDGALWAIDEAWLTTIRGIALGEGEGAEAVAAKLGRPLQNAQRVMNRDGVAVIPVVGPIFRYANVMTEVSGATSIELLARDLRAAVDDPSIRGIILEVNSPGGQVDGVAETAAMIRAATAAKPLNAYISGYGTSAAYWLASAADEVIVSPTALVGNIGAVLGVQRTDKQRADTAEFVSSQSPNKRPNIDTDEGRAQVQGLVDAIADVFIDAVASYRDVSRETVLTDFGAGGLRVGRAAVEAGMADRQGSLETMIAEMSAYDAAAAKPKRRQLKWRSVMQPSKAQSTPTPASS